MEAIEEVATIRLHAPRPGHPIHDDNDVSSQRRESETASSSYENATSTTTTSMAYLPQTIVLCELRHDEFEARVPTGPSDSRSVSKWRPKDRVQNGDLATGW